MNSTFIVTPPADTATCSRCGETEPLSNFGRCSRKKNGHKSACKECLRLAENTRDRTRRNEYAKKWRAAKGQEHQHKAQVRYRYGVTDDWYDTTLAAQGGLCAACGEPETETRLGVVRLLSVDHNHQTGEVRGFLCNSCNRTIGYAREDATRLAACAAYLRRFE